MKSFFIKYKAYIAFSLAFLCAMALGYFVQLGRIRRDLSEAEAQTQAFITESDTVRSEEPPVRVLPEAFPDTGYPEEPLVTEETVTTASDIAFQPAPPINGSLSKGYSEKPVYSVTLDDWRSHEAIDVAASEGDTVCAVDAGTVTDIGQDPLFGVFVRIRHCDGFESFYANLHGEVTVSEGQTVEKGHPVGYIGTTALIEQSEVPHLHFELFKEGKHVRPGDYIK